MILVMILSIHYLFYEPENHLILNIYPITFASTKNQNNASCYPKMLFLQTQKKVVLDITFAEKH